MMLKLLLAGLLTGQVGTTPPLAPASRWTVDYAQKMCSVSRAYGDPAHPIIVAFKPTPFSDIMLAVILGNRQQLGKEARLDVMLEAPGRDLGPKQTGTRVYFPKSDNAALTYYVSRGAFEALVDAPAFTVRPKNGPVISVALSMPKPLLTALRKCEDRLMTQMGFDPVKIAAIATRAEGDDPAAWIGYGDYPLSSIAKGEQGTVTIAWTISSIGRVSDCQILESSGAPDLDRAACDAIVKRGRYRRPALDASGKAVESYSTRRVMWSLPG